jgi:hypothetical protein
MSNLVMCERGFGWLVMEGLETARRALNMHSAAVLIVAGTQPD